MNDPLKQTPMCELDRDNRLNKVTDEKDFDLAMLREERDQLYGYVNGLLGLMVLLRGRNDVPADVKDAMRTSHRVVDAAAYLTQIVPPQSK